ncbi:hypothetical protein GMSM_07700 [Geomonas sp. Red276]
MAAAADTEKRTGRVRAKAGGNLEFEKLPFEVGAFLLHNPHAGAVPRGGKGNETGLPFHPAEAGAAVT